MIYLQLFLSFLQIGAFSFGGGYAACLLYTSWIPEIYWNQLFGMFKIYRPFYFSFNIEWVLN